MAKVRGLVVVQQYSKLVVGTVPAQQKQYKRGLKNMNEKTIIGKIIVNAILNKNCRKQLKLHCEIMKFRSHNYEQWEYAEMYISDLMRRKEVE